mmetsp:Transcript_5624/g.8654  ORF Transcript_5624/g.8654 Transcript_5624/m.8654 type:complete len:234 (+) Transcript_5624:889-1590(+)
MNASSMTLMKKLKHLRRINCCNSRLRKKKNAKRRRNVRQSAWKKSSVLNVKLRKNVSPKKNALKRNNKLLKRSVHRKQLLKLSTKNWLKSKLRRMLQPLMMEMLTVKHSILLVLLLAMHSKKMHLKLSSQQLRQNLSLQWKLDQVKLKLKLIPRRLMLMKRRRSLNNQLHKLKSMLKLNLMYWIWLLKNRQKRKKVTKRKVPRRKTNLHPDIMKLLLIPLNRAVMIPTLNRMI